MAPEGSENVLKFMSTAEHPIEQLQVGNETYWVRECDFDVVNEPWGSYELKDGGRIRQRIVTARIYKLFSKQADGSFVPVLDEKQKQRIFTETMTQLVFSS